MMERALRWFLAVSGALLGVSVSVHSGNSCASVYPLFTLCIRAMVGDPTGRRRERFKELGHSTVGLRLGLELGLYE